MIVLAVVFALQCIDNVYLHTGIQDWLVLSGIGLRHGFVWQLITFQFLHSGWLHVFFNLLGLWWMGIYCERLMGRWRMFTALVGCGTVGGLLQGGLMLIAPEHYGSYSVGASAGISGLTAIFCLLERDSIIRLWGIVPIPAIVFLYGFGALSLFFTVVPAEGGSVAHAAHLGGILAGVLWVRRGYYQEYQPLPGQELWEWLRHRLRPQKRASVPWPASEWRSRRVLTSEKSNPPGAPQRDEFITREVDPILEKIAAHGIQSLTPAEREILQSARQRMAGR